MFNDNNEAQYQQLLCFIKNIWYSQRIERYVTWCWREIAPKWYLEILTYMLIHWRWVSIIQIIIILKIYSQNVCTCISLKMRRLHKAWWRHQMETFSAWLAICAENSPVPGEFPAQRPVTRSFDVFFDLRLNKRLSKQSWGWWFETISCSLWRHRNGTCAWWYIMT